MKQNAWIACLLVTLTGTATQAASDQEDIWCRWKIKGSKGSADEENRTPCQVRNINGTKKITQEYIAQGKKFRVEYLEDPQGAEPFKAKVNGKIGTMQEENRYSFGFKSDDLTIQFDYDAVLPNPKYTKASIQGVWSEDVRTGCKSDDPRVISVKGDTVIRYGGESVCKIYKMGQTTAGSANVTFMKCDNEGTIDKEAWNFERTGKREARVDSFKQYQLCSGR